MDLQGNGWEPVAQKGSHIHLKHPVKAGRVTVPPPNRDLPIGTLKSIERQTPDQAEIAMRQYIALIHKDAASDYGVSFPDLPGCVTAGLDLDDARRMAEEALDALHLGAWRRTTARFQNPPRWKPGWRIGRTATRSPFLSRQRRPERSESI